jgi:hypothetical protein
VAGPGTLSFWWKVSSQTNADFLSFSFGGTQRAAVSGEVDWQQQTYYLPAGAQTLQWVYAKDASVSAGQDKAWLDQVSYTFGPTVPLIVKQPANQFVLPGGAASLSVGAVGTPSLRYQWRRNGANIPGATSAAFSISPVGFTNSGAYSALVSNDYGFTISADALLGVSGLLAWGNNDFGQAAVPVGLTNLVAIAAGAYHTLALRGDGLVLAWGDDYDGQCDVPTTLTNATGIAGGSYHSLAVRSDGSVTAWGANYSGQVAVPAMATNVVSVAAGDSHSLALKEDGTVIGWGDDSFGQTQIPPGASNVVAIAAGGQHSLALRSDGSVIAWGSDVGPDGLYAGQSDVPWDLHDVVAIAAGAFHSLALNANGAVVAWGENAQGQTTIPSSLSKAIAIAAGGAHSLAVAEGGTVVAWGDNLYHQSAGGPSTSDAIAVAAGSYHSVALLGRNLLWPQLVNPSNGGSQFSVSVATTRGRAYFLEYKNSLTDPDWRWSTSVVGNGSIRTLSDPTSSATHRFYRLRQQ